MAIYEFKYDPEKKRIIKEKIMTKERIGEWIKRTLNTERNAYPIYDHQYGVELLQFKNQPSNFYIAQMEDTIREALLMHEDIIDVIDFEFKIVKNMLFCTFQVQTRFGNITITHKEDR